MRWRIINQSTKDSYVVAESTDREGFKYYGFMKDFQPHGLGALHKDEIFVACGFWENGILLPENILAKEEYDAKMNEIFNGSN